MEILIADNHSLYRESLKCLLEQLATSIKVHEADDCRMAQQVVVAHQGLDLALLDYELPTSADGLVLAEIIHGAGTIPCVVMISEIDKPAIQHLLRLGALGIISKQQSGSSILDAIQHVLTGGLYIPEPNRSMITRH